MFLFVALFCLIFALQEACRSPKHAPRLEGVKDILVRRAAAEAKSAAASGGVGGGRSARSLKAAQLLLQELARD